METTYQVFEYLHSLADRYSFPLFAADKIGGN